MSKKSRNFVKCLTYVLPQVIGLSRHRRNQLSGGAFPVFPSLSQGHRKFLQNKIKSKFLCFRVLAGGFVMGYAKKSWFSANIKISRKVCKKSEISD